RLGWKTRWRDRVRVGRGGSHRRETGRRKVAAMRVSFRTKLLGIVGTAAAGFVLMIVVSSFISARAERRVTGIQELYVPKIELGPKLESQFEKISRSMQDAVAAHDADALTRSREHVDLFLSQLDAAKAAVDPKDAAAL